MHRTTTIIPVASGKGGVGKSLLSANLSIALAQMGHDTVAVDLDLGGSNLHSYFGLPNKYPGIGDFLKGNRSDFDRLLLKTDVDNLRFLPGDGKIPFMANIPGNQRLMLTRSLCSIKARYIILDLGAGSAMNTLAFFGLANKGLIVTTSEVTANLNFLTFLKNFLLSIVSSVVREDKKMLATLHDAFRRPMGSEPLTIRSLLKTIDGIDPALAQRIQEICSRYRPRIIINMGDHPDELQICSKIETALKQNLSMEADFFGFVFFDDQVRKALRAKERLLVDRPESMVSQNIRQIARRITKYWDHPIKNSKDLIIKDTQKRYERLAADPSPR